MGIEAAGGTLATVAGAVVYWLGRIGAAWLGGRAGRRAIETRAAAEHLAVREERLWRLLVDERDRAAEERDRIADERDRAVARASALEAAVGRARSERDRARYHVFAVRRDFARRLSEARLRSRRLERELAAARAGGKGGDAR